MQFKHYLNHKAGHICTESDLLSCAPAVGVFFVKAIEVSQILEIVLSR